MLIALRIFLLLGMLYPFFAPPGAAASGEGAVDDLLDVFFHGLTA